MKQITKDYVASKRKAYFFFTLGWILTLVNLFGLAWAIYLPFDLSTRIERFGGLFFFDEQGRYALWMSLALLGFSILAILQILFTNRIIIKLVDDIPETYYAESAFRIAYITSWVTVIVCMTSFMYDIRFARDWLKIYEQIQK